VNIVTEILRGTKQNGRPEGTGTPVTTFETKRNYMPFAGGAMSMLVSFSVSPSTLPFTVT
jgi:hypothetical protein